jgi:hypothetical protein
MFCFSIDEIEIHIALQNAVMTAFLEIDDSCIRLHETDSFSLAQASFSMRLPIRVKLCIPIQRKILKSVGTV